MAITGTGKSGYIRLLNNAFYNSRGDKNILANLLTSLQMVSPHVNLFYIQRRYFRKYYPSDKIALNFLNIRFSIPKALKYILTMTTN